MLPRRFALPLEAIDFQLKCGILDNIDLEYLLAWPELTVSPSSPVSLHTCSFSEEGFKPVPLIPLICKCPDSNLSLFKPNYRLVHTINIDPIAVTPAHYLVLTRSPISSEIDLRDFAPILRERTQTYSPHV